MATATNNNVIIDMPKINLTNSGPEEICSISAGIGGKHVVLGFSINKWFVEGTPKDMEFLIGTWPEKAEIYKNRVGTDSYGRIFTFLLHQNNIEMKKPWFRLRPIKK